MSRLIKFSLMFVLCGVTFAQWTVPEPAEIQLGSAVRDVWISNDGLRMYASGGLSAISISTRPSHTAQWQPFERLPDHINFTSTQFSPCESPTGDTLYWVSAERPEGGEGGRDIYYSVRTDTGWGQVFNAGPNINTWDFEWSVAISRDGSLLLVSTNILAVQGGEDIYYSEKQPNGTWGSLVNYGENVNTTENDRDPTLSPGGDRIFFYQEGPSRGNILSSIKIDGEWQPSESLPSPVNTLNGREQGPCMSADGRTLWFVHDSNDGTGGRIMWTTDTTVSAADEARSPISSQFILNCYPNPFNPVTTLTISLAMMQEVEVGLYDVTGRYVKTIARERMTAGEHSLRVDAAGLPSGVYFARARGVGFSGVTRLVLVK